MIALRPAIADDVPILRAMVQALANHEGGTAKTGAPVGSEAGFRTGGFGPRPLFWSIIAEQARQPIGMVIYYPDFSTHRGQAGVYVQDIYVNPKARGKGLARTLLAEVMAVQDWEARYMTLGVSRDNEVAVLVYGKLGFRHRGYDFLILDGQGLTALSAS